MISKNYLAKTLAASLLCFWLPSAYAADSTITISGYVRDNACAVAAESKNFDIDLMQNATKQFPAVGTGTPYVPFNILLSPCGNSVTAVKIGFTGISDDNNPSLLKLDSGTQSASGIGVQILDSNKLALPVNNSSSLISWVPLRAGESNTVNFYARLIASRVPVTAGIVRATAVFTPEFQ
ncbi:MAG: Protein FimF [Candidatus Erwinia impunctatus]|nr:Protein FimF [Culicoides impunctatus]